MFLAICFLVFGVGMVLSHPGQEKKPGSSSWPWIMGARRCRGQLGSNNKWLKYRKGNCYNCECIGKNALCRIAPLYCPELPVNCENPIIPPAKECSCPRCPSTENYKRAANFDSRVSGGKQSI